MYYVKVSDPCGEDWHEYISRTEAEAYALSIDGELYEDAKDNTTDI